MDDPKKHDTRNRAFVPPWQLHSSPDANLINAPSRVAAPVNSQIRPPSSLSNQPPPLPPRNGGANNIPRHMRTPFSATSPSVYGQPSSFLSAYSSPFLGSASYSRPPGVNWDLFSATSSASRLLPCADSLTGAYPWLGPASPALEGIERLAMTARSICLMVESTYQVNMYGGKMLHVFSRVLRDSTTRFVGPSVGP